MLVCDHGRSTFYQSQEEEESPVSDIPEIVPPETSQTPTSRKEREKWGTLSFFSRARQTISQRQGGAFH
jgi:hypothetical protein